MTEIRGATPAPPIQPVKANESAPQAPAASVLTGAAPALNGNLADGFVRSTPKPPAPGGAVAQALSRVGNGTVSRDRAVTRGSVEAVVLNDADASRNEIAEALLALVKEAKQEVRIQTYVWEDPSGQALMAALAEKQRETPNFKVYIAYDRDRALPKALAEAGVKAYTARYADPWSRSSNHSKAFIVDGHTAVIGSFNVEDKAMKDVAVKLRGPVVETLLDDFDHAWRHSKAWTGPGAKRVSEPAPPPRVKGVAPPASGQLVPMTFLSKAGVGRDGADARANDANEGILAALTAAKTEIKLASPNLNDSQVWDAIAAAARRGVQVKILVPKGFNQTASWIDRAPNDRVLRLIAKLPEAAQKKLTMRWSSDDGERHVKSHVKYVSVDGKWAYVGSQNLDNQSWAFSREGGVGIDDATTVGRLDDQLFDQAWEKGLAARPGRFDRWLLPPARDWTERVQRWVSDPRGLISEFF